MEKKSSRKKVPVPEITVFLTWPTNNLDIYSETRDKPHFAKEKLVKSFFNKFKSYWCSKFM